MNRPAILPGEAPLPTAATSEKRAWLERARSEAVHAHRDALTRESRWSWTRLGIFLVLLGVWIASLDRPLYGIVATLGGGVLFVFAIRHHRRAESERQQLDRMLLVLDESLARCGGQVRCVRDWRRPALIEVRLPRVWETGAVWRLTEQELDDLDLYSAPVGVFGLLNRTSSPTGAARLRETLESPLLTPERILARQHMVRWLADHAAARLALQAGQGALRDEDRRLLRLLRGVRRMRRVRLPFSRGVLRAWSAASGLFAVVCIAQLLVGTVSWGGLLLGLLLVNGAVYARMRKALRAALAPWNDVSWAARGLAHAVDAAGQELPDSTDLASLRGLCATIAGERTLQRIATRAAWAESGGGVHQLLNLLVFLDVHVALAIEELVVPRRAALLSAASAVAELEVLCGTASLAWEQPVTCWPQLVDELRLTIDNGRHPLVDPQRVVANTLDLGSPATVWTITGSNMAGKSTFLRMAGVNLLLAQIGGPASAERMEWRPMRLMTDLRARDSLAEGESYFLSEVRHLRRMVTPPEDGAPLLGLIDEPFRGTNSQDQTAASVAVLRHLLRQQNFYLLATHDRHLTSLDDARCRNVHFRENLGDSGMVFDYKLHDGPAVTRNALRILEIEGYPESLMQDAYAWLEHADKRNEMRDTRDEQTRENKENRREETKCESGVTKAE